MTNGDGATGPLTAGRRVFVIDTDANGELTVRALPRSLALARCPCMFSGTTDEKVDDVRGERATWPLIADARRSGHTTTAAGPTAASLRNYGPMCSSPCSARCAIWRTASSRRVRTVPSTRGSRTRRWVCSSTSCRTCEAQRGGRGVRRRLRVPGVADRKAARLDADDGPQPHGHRRRDARNSMVRTARVSARGSSRAIPRMLQAGRRRGAARSSAFAGG